MQDTHLQEIAKEISVRYDLDIKNIVTYKEGYLLNTTRGKRILKKSILSPERIIFINSAKEHLVGNGFNNLDRGVCAEDGMPYATIEGNNYTITEAVEGIECNFDSRNDIVNAARLLSSMHKASKGFTPPEDSRSRDELGKIPDYFNKRLDEIKKLKKVASKGRNSFDCLFLKNYGYFTELGETAIDMLKRSKYDEIVKQTRKDGLFCHHDYTYHNIILNSGKYMVKNFEYCCLEIKVHDIANLLRRKMRKCNWDINEAKVIIDEYRSIEDISSDEFFILKIILMFPQKFWRVINKYYNSRRSWSERSYTLKLQEVIEEIEYHKRFINGFDRVCAKRL